MSKFGGASYDKKVFLRAQQHSESFYEKLTGETAKLAIKISRDSMKRAPKNVLKAQAAGRPFQKYDERVVTTFKSGKKKGQRREFTRKGLYSAPGSPPRHRAPGMGGLKAQTFDRVSPTEVVYGPLLFEDSYANKTNSDEHPYIHEHGGTFTRTIKFKSRKRKKSKLGRPKTNSEFQRVKAAKKRGDRLPSRTAAERVRYPKRPYMIPAQNKAFGKIMRKVRSIARRA